MASDVAIQINVKYASEIQAGLRADSAALKAIAVEIQGVGTAASAASIKTGEASKATVDQATAVERAAGTSRTFWEQQKIAAAGLKTAQGELNAAIVQGAGDYGLLIGKVQQAQEKVAELAIAQEKGNIAATSSHLQLVAGPSTVSEGSQFTNEMTAAEKAATEAANAYALAVTRGDVDLAKYAVTARETQAAVDSLADAQVKGAEAASLASTIPAGPSTVPLGAQFTNEMASAQARATEAANAYAAAWARDDAALASYEVTAKAAQDEVTLLTVAQLKAAEASNLLSTSEIKAAISTDAQSVSSRASALSMTEMNAAARTAGAGVDFLNLQLLLTKGNLALLGAAIVALSFKEFADFQQALANMRGNTGQTAEQVAVVKQQVLDLGAQGPIALGDLVTAFRHASDESFQNADAAKIVKAAWEGAIATGGNVGDVANTLARELHNWSAGASEATQTMGVLLVGAQSGNQTLEQLVTSLSKVGPLAAAVKMPLVDAVSLVSEFTKATGNPSIAQTWATNLITHIVGPSKAAITVMTELKQATGIDLERTFQQFSSGQISFLDVMQKVQSATHNNAQEIMTLFGGIRGGTGALQFLTHGMADYEAIQARTADGANQLKIQVASQQDTLAYKWGTLKNSVIEFGIGMGDALNGGLNKISELNDAANKLDGTLRHLPVIGGLFDKESIPETQKQVEALKLAQLAQLGFNQAQLDGIKNQWAMQAAQKANTAAILEGAKAQQAYYSAGGGNTKGTAGSVSIPTSPVDATKYGQSLQSNYSNAIAVQLDDQMKNNVSQFKADAEAIKTARDELDRYQKLQYEAEGPQRKFTASLAAAARQLDASFAKFGAPEAAVTGQIDELKHQSALIALNTSLSQEQRALQQAQLQVEMDLRQIALDTLKETQINQSPTATPEQKAQASQTVTNDFSKLGEDRVAVGNASQAVVAKAVQDGFSRQERGISAQMVELQHQSTMIGLNTSLSADQKAILQDSKQIQIDQKQIQLDTLKLSADIALGKSGKANLPADRVAIQTDRNTLDEHQQQKTNDVATSNANAVQAHYTKLEGLQTTQINALSHQSTMIGLNTSLSAEQKAVMQAALAVQIGQRQIALDTLKLQAAIASKDPNAIAAAKSALQQDEYKQTENNATLKNAKATDEATRAIQRWTQATNEHTLEATNALDALALGIRNHDTPAQLAKLADAAAKAQSSVNGDGTAHDRAASMVTALLDPGMKLAGIFKQIADSGQSAADFLTKTFGRQGAQHVFGFGGLGVTGSQLEHANDPKTPPPTEADITKDITSKDWSKAASDNTAAFQAGTITQKEYITNQQAINQHTAAWNKTLMEADAATGDYIGAAAIAKQGYLDGNVSLQTYVGLQKQANTETDQNNQKLIAADVALGDFTDALSLATKAYHDGTMSFTDYVSILKGANAETAANTKKDWLANYAAGDPSTQRSMMNAALQPMISQQSTIQSATGAVDSANLQVIAANSALTVAKITDATTAVTDLSGIMSAQAGEVTAQYQGQIAAINDGSAILQAKSQDQLTQFATLQTIAKDTASGTAQQVALDRQLLAAQQKVGADSIRVAELTAQMNQSIARDQLTVARDNVKQAQDKMSVDAANAAAQGTVLMDQLAVAKDNYQLAVDQKQLTMDTLPILEDIAYQLGSDQPYADQVKADLNAVAGDEKQGSLDQQKLGNDQASANQIAASGGLLLAGDQSQTGSDQIASTKDQQIWDLQIAEAKAQQAQDTVLVQTIQANISALQANTANLAAVNASQTTLEKALRAALNQAYQPGSRKYVGSSSTANNLFGSLATQGRMGGM